MRKIISMIILVAFISTSVKSPAYAQLASVDPMPFMPKPGVMVHLSPEYTPAYLKGIVIHPENALKFDFIIYKGDKFLTDEQKRVEYTKLTKYFLASLAIPDNDQWVNLSPYEKDRIIKDDFGKTEMGRDLLAQDYLLKQITASLIYPQDNLGKKFWDRVYTEAQEQYGTSNIPVNTFNKVWILPDDALIYEKGNTAYVLKNHLRVMLEEDYLALKKHSGIQSATIDNKTHSIASKIIKQIILPELEREVNEDANFATVRQVYSGMLLATWYKRALRESLLSKIYANKSKVKGVDQDPQNNEKIYKQYLRAYKKGVFNFIKEDVDKYTNEVIPRKYFSGGFEAYGSDNQETHGVIKEEHTLTPDQNEAMMAALQNNLFEVAGVGVDETLAAAQSDAAMSSTQELLDLSNDSDAHSRFTRDPSTGFIYFRIQQGREVSDLNRYDLTYSDYHGMVQIKGPGINYSANLTLSHSRRIALKAIIRAVIEEGEQLKTNSILTAERIKELNQLLTYLPRNIRVSNLTGSVRLFGIPRLGGDGYIMVTGSTEENGKSDVTIDWPGLNPKYENNLDINYSWRDIVQEAVEQEQDAAMKVPIARSSSQFFNLDSNLTVLRGVNTVITVIPLENGNVEVMYKDNTKETFLNPGNRVFTSAGGATTISLTGRTSRQGLEISNNSNSSSLEVIKEKRSDMAMQSDIPRNIVASIAENEETSEAENQKNREEIKSRAARMTNEYLRTHTPDVVDGIKSIDEVTNEYSDQQTAPMIKMILIAWWLTAKYGLSEDQREDLARFLRYGYTGEKAAGHTIIEKIKNEASEMMAVRLLTQQEVYGMIPLTRDQIEHLQNLTDEKAQQLHFSFNPKIPISVAGDVLEWPVYDVLKGLKEKTIFAVAHGDSKYFIAVPRPSTDLLEKTAFIKDNTGIVPKVSSNAVYLVGRSLNEDPLVMSELKSMGDMLVKIQKRITEQRETESVRPASQVIRDLGNGNLVAVHAYGRTQYIQGDDFKRTYEGSLGNGVEVTAGKGTYRISVENDKVIFQQGNSIIRRDLELGNSYTVGRNMKPGYITIQGNNTLSGKHFSFEVLGNKENGYTIFVQDLESTYGTLVTPDAAMGQESTTKGGIDFNSANLNLQIKRDGNGVPLPISQQDLQNINIDGLVPIIIDIKPATSLPIFAQLQNSSNTVNG